MRSRSEDSSFSRLIDATGPATATILLSVIYAVIGSLGPNGTSLSFVVTMVAGVLFSMAYLRTHALWLGWGMHFAWAAATAVVLGPAGCGRGELLQRGADGHERPPVADRRSLSGRRARCSTAIVFFVAMASVYRATRNYAWSYTHPEIVPGGYPMDVPPPPAHTAMEEAAAAKTATLVQIAPAPSSNGSERSSSPESAHRP